MTKFLDISFDVETWGKRPGCDLRSIGACTFNMYTGDVAQEGEAFSFYTACDNPWVYISGDPDNPDSYGCSYGLRQEPDTVEWWDKQSEEAQAAFDNPVDLKQALNMFVDWMDDLSEATGITDRQNIRIWAHGYKFDPTIIDEVFRVVGIPLPWHYRSPRDTRTIFDLAGIYDHSAWLKKFRQGIPHHALHDAISQAKGICGAQSELHSSYQLRQ